MTEYGANSRTGIQYGVLLLQYRCLVMHIRSLVYVWYDRIRLYDMNHYTTQVSIQYPSLSYVFFDRIWRYVTNHVQYRFVLI